MLLPTLSGPALAAGQPLKGDVVVIGAGGKTGLECVRYCVANGRSVRACTRSGDFDALELLGTSTSLVKPGKTDVTQPASLPPSVAGASLVIFAASASKSGGPPASVDNAGLVNTARACVDAKVPRLVVVSSGAVTKPSSPVYLFLNLFGGIMAEKIAGEDAVRALYASSAPPELAYTIIRPGARAWAL